VRRFLLAGLLASAFAADGTAATTMPWRSDTKDGLQHKGSAPVQHLGRRRAASGLARQRTRSVCVPRI